MLKKLFGKKSKKGTNAGAESESSSSNSLTTPVVAAPGQAATDDFKEWRPSVPPVMNWVGKPIPADQFDITLVFAKADEKFANVIGNALKQAGFQKTIWSYEEVQEPRATIIVLSDNTELDDIAVRKVTRAFERFNSNDATIFCIIAPYTTNTVLDNVPNNLAYALASTPFVDFKHNIHNPAVPFKFLYDMLTSYLTQTTTAWDLSGTWSCETSLRGEFETTTWWSKDFTVLLDHDKDTNQINGICAQGVKISGTIKDTELSLQLSYATATEGTWHEDDAMWYDENYTFSATIDGIISNHGTYFEGLYTQTTKAGKASGIIKGNLQTRGISGYYKVHYSPFPGETEGHEEYMGITHAGGLQVNADLRGFFESNVGGFYEKDTGAMHFMHWYGAQCGLCIVGHMEPDRTFTGKTFRARFGKNVTGNVNFRGAPFTLRDKPPVKEIVPLNLEEFGQNVSAEFVFRKADFRHLQKGEFATLIACTKYEAKEAENLKKHLLEQKIEPITTDLKDAKNARSVIFLLSDKTKENRELIDVICERAQVVPLYIIGMKLWADIFDDKVWDPKSEARKKLSDSLARLNLTDYASVASKNNPNFRALLTKLQAIKDPPKPAITGIWVLRNSTLTDALTPSLLFISVAGSEMVLMAFAAEDESQGKATKGTSRKFAGKIIDFEADLKSEYGDTLHLALNKSQDLLHGVLQPSKGARRTVTYSLNNSSITGFYTIPEPGSKPFENFVVISQLGTNTVFGFHKNDRLFGVVRGSQVIWMSGLSNPTTINVCCTNLSIENSQRVLQGFTYTSNLGNGGQDFKCYSHYGVVRVRDRGVKQECSDPKVVQVVTQYFQALNKDNNYYGVTPLLPSDLIMERPDPINQSAKLPPLYSEDDFNKARSEILITGPFESIANFVGSLVLEGLEKDWIRYEFDIKFRDSNITERYVFKLDQEYLLREWGSIRNEAQKYRTYMYDAMISYRSKDGNFIDRLMEFLDSKGFVTWRDRRMEIGSNWSNDIATAVRFSTCFLAAISFSYIHSAPCTREVHMATEVGKTILPILLPQTEDKPWDKVQVFKYYPHSQPPITIARELAPSPIIDMRNPTAGTDAQNLDQFVQKYAKPLKYLEQQMRNVIQNQSIYNVTGRWIVTLDQMLPSSKRIAVDLVFTHTADIHASGYIDSMKLSLVQEKNVPLIGARFDLAFHEPVPKGKSLDEVNLFYLILTVKLNADGNQFEGYFVTFNSNNQSPSFTHGRATATRAILSDNSQDITARKACPEAWVEDKVDRYWNSLTIRDFSALRSMMNDDIANFEDADVEGLRDEHIAKNGEYTYSSFVQRTFYKLANEQGHLALYEFSCNFTKTKNNITFFLFDTTSRLLRWGHGSQEDLDKAKAANEIPIK